MKTILVTGSNGFLGQKITEKIIVSGRYQLIATAKGKNRFPTSNGYTYVEMDILDSEQVQQVILEHKPDAIIHTAALTNVDACHVQRDLAYKLNVTAVETLTSICAARNIHLIHLSTDFVFDGLAGPYSENAISHPVSYYGETKLMGENIVQRSHCNWTIIRTILVYGTIKDTTRSNIVFWAKSALEKGDPIKVVNDQFRMPTLVDDLADACLRCVERKAFGIYHISGKDMMSIAELVGRVADFWKLDKSLITEISSAELNQEAKRPIKTGFLLDKAKEKLGYDPHSLEEGLAIVAQQLMSNRK